MVVLVKCFSVDWIEINRPCYRALNILTVNLKKLRNFQLCNVLNTYLLNLSRFLCV